MWRGSRTHHCWREVEAPLNCWDLLPSKRQHPDEDWKQLFPPKCTQIASFVSYILYFIVLHFEFHKIILILSLVKFTMRFNSSFLPFMPQLPPPTLPSFLPGAPCPLASVLGFVKIFWVFLFGSLFIFTWLRLYTYGYMIYSPHPREKMGK